MTVLDETNNRRLFKELSALRKGRYSVLWAILRGRASPARIALLLGWTPQLVDKALMQCYEEGLIIPHVSNNGNWLLDKEHEDFARFQEMKELGVLIELEVPEAYPAARIEDGYFSRAALTRLDPEVVKAQRNERMVYLLWPNQWTCLQGIRESFATDEVFSARQYQVMRKTSRADYALNELKALMKRGMVVPVNKAGKSTYWQLTEMGSTYEHVEMKESARKDLLAGVDKKTGSIGKTEDPNIVLLANAAEGMTTREVAEARGITRSAAHRQLSRLLDGEKVNLQAMDNGSNRWTIA